MGDELRRVSFTKDDLDAAQEFDCGDEPWARYVSEWIRGGPDGVKEALEKNTKVWLYLTEDGDIVGYGSLGVTKWRYPNPNKSDYNYVSLIPAFAVQRQFHGKPEGNWQKRYATQIMSDLIHEAKLELSEYPQRLPLLGLFVQRENLRAIAFYKRIGFQQFGKETPPERDTGIVYVRMVLNLEEM